MSFVCSVLNCNREDLGARDLCHMHYARWLRHGSIEDRKRIPWNTGRVGSMSGANNGRWNGGRKTHAHGYILIASPNHKYKDKQGYVREHRLVMEKHIGRYLIPTEDVHHKDDDKTNNSISNLELFQSRSDHLKARHQTGGQSGWFKKGQVAHNKYLVPIPCAYCADKFKPSSKSKKYCSRVCYWDSKRGIVPPQLIRS